jgi:hypothetical protein
MVAARTAIPLRFGGFRRDLCCGDVGLYEQTLAIIDHLTGQACPEPLIAPPSLIPPLGVPEGVRFLLMAVRK